MDDCSNLLHEIETFLAAHRLADTTFGLKAVNDGKLVDRLRAGGDVTTRKAERIRRFMAEHDAQCGPPPSRQSVA